MKKFSLSTLLALTALTAWAVDLPRDTAVVTGTLKNGLTYIIRHNEYPKERANFYIVQRVGAVLEEDNQNGLAHFLEHMAFNGTKNFPDKGIIDYLETLGVKFGENINAYTSYDVTVYNIDNVPTTRESIVDSALLVLHDWSGFITLDGEEIDKERGVIREEWRTRNNANRRMYFAHQRNTKQGTPYATRDVIGDTAVINNFTYDELRAYYKKWYRPDLQTIIIVGDVDARRVEQKIERLWKDIANKKKSRAQRVYSDVEIEVEPVISIAQDAEATRTTIELDFRRRATPIEMRNTEEDYAQQLTRAVGTKAVALRLAELTDQPKNPCAMAYCEDYLEAPTLSTLAFGAIAKVDSTAAAIDFVVEEAEKIRRYGLGEGEVDVAKASIVKHYENAFASRAKRKNDSYTKEYVSVAAQGDPMPSIDDELALVKKLLPQITAESINELLRNDMQQGVVVKLSAPTSVELPTAQALRQTLGQAKQKQLERYADKHYDQTLVDHTPSAADIVKQEEAWLGSTLVELSNGVQIYLLPTKNTDDKVLLSAQSRGGKSLLNADEVVAATCIDDLSSTSGKGQYSASELRKILSSKTVKIASRIGTYSETIEGSSTTKDIETLLQLVYLSFGQMRVDSDAYAVVLDSYRTALANAELNPQKALSDTLHAITSQGNPYQQTLDRQTINTLRHDVVLDIYKKRFGNAADFTFFLVGDFDAATITPKLQTWLGALPTEAQRDTIIPRNLVLPKGLITKHFQQRMSTPKTTCVIIFSGEMDYTRPRSLTLTMLRDLLRMRYLDTIREEEGGSYGVSCQASLSGAVEQAYRLTLRFDTDPEMVDKLRPIIDREIEKIAKEGPDALDFFKVKENLVKQRHEQLQQDAVWLKFLTDNVLWGIDLYTDFEKQVQDVGADDVKEMAKKILADGNVIDLRMNPEK